MIWAVNLVAGGAVDGTGEASRRSGGGIEVGGAV